VCGAGAGARLRLKHDETTPVTPPGITVDTHVQRLARRWGLTKQEDPEKIERDLMALVPEQDWTIFSHRTIFHGRQACFARRPNCDGCLLRKDCPKIGVMTSDK